MLAQRLWLLVFEGTVGEETLESRAAGAKEIRGYLKKQS
jgi:hypothetical protein